MKKIFCNRRYIVSFLVFCIASCLWFLAVVNIFIFYEKEPENPTHLLLLMGGNQDRLRMTASISKKFPTACIYLFDPFDSADKGLNKNGVRRTEIKRMVVENLVELGVKADMIKVFPGPSVNTCGEVQLLKDVLKDEKEYEVAIITSSYHTGRTKQVIDWVFRDRSPKNLFSFPNNRFSAILKNNWYKTPEGIRITFLEFCKLHYFYLTRCK